MSGSSQDLLKTIRHYQDNLDRYSSSSENNYKIVNTIKKLGKLPIATSHLEDTGVGRTVNSLRKFGGEVGELATGLIDQWKRMVQTESETKDNANRTDDECTSSSESEDGYGSSLSQHSSDNDENISSDERNKNLATSANNSSRSNERKVEVNVRDSKHSHEYKGKERDDTKRKYVSSSSESEEECKKQAHKSKSHKSHMSKDVRNKDKSNGHRSSYSHKSSHDKKDDRDKEKLSGKDNTKRKRTTSTSDSEDENPKNKHSKSNFKHRGNSNEEDDKKKKSNEMKDLESENNRSSNKSKTSKSDVHESSSSRSKSHDKTESTSKTKLSRSDENKSSTRYGKNHTSSEVEETREKSRSKYEKESKESKSHPSHSSKHDKRDKKEKDDSKKHRKDGLSGHEDKQKPPKDETKKDKKAASSSSKNKETKVKSEGSKQKTNAVNTEIIVNGIGSESGASFEEALGMCGTTAFGKASSSKKKPSLPSTEKLSKVPSTLVASKSERTEMTEEKYVPVPSLLKKVPVEPLNVNISNLLPDLTPNYRPIAFPIDTQPKRILTPDEALSQAISNKNLRTKVYSGNKAKGQVESLFKLCIRVIQDNLDAMECTGGVPYDILKPILEKANPDQLFNLEHHNPYLIEDTDELWRLHCIKDFKTKRREEMETWREMYLRCLQEREARLSSITASIKQAQDKLVPVRTTKLAYVDSVAKPPRNIARKQLKNGIPTQKETVSSKLATLAKAGEASKVAVPNPGNRAVDRASTSSSSNVKPKKAPLMAKSLSLFKNRFKR